MTIGIYAIKNLKNNMVYIGSSKNIEHRFSVHKCKLKGNYHFNENLQNDWNLYGFETFEFVILEECNKEELFTKEECWIEQNLENIYNIFLKTDLNGYELPIKTREKIREKAIGRKVSDSAKKKMSDNRRGEKNIMYGKNHSEESKEKMKLANGVPKSEAYLGEGNPFHGRKHSDETKSKISKANKGKKLRAKLTIEEIILIRQMLDNDFSCKEIAEKFNVGYTCILKIKNRERWNDV